MHLKNKSNDYVEYMNDELYAEIPKTVFAAIAISFALRLNEDNTTKAIVSLLAEWRTLYENGIVPQKPYRSRRAKAEDSQTREGK